MTQHRVTDTIRVTMAAPPAIGRPNRGARSSATNGNVQTQTATLSASLPLPPAVAPSSQSRDLRQTPRSHTKTRSGTSVSRMLSVSIAAPSRIGSPSDWVDGNDKVPE